MIMEDKTCMIIYVCNASFSVILRILFGCNESKSKPFSVVSFVFALPVFADLTNTKYTEVVFTNTASHCYVYDTSSV